MEIVVDISPNIHRNELSIWKSIVSTLHLSDIGIHKVVLKSQLFEIAGKNLVQDRGMFALAAQWAWEYCGYKTTSSVFDRRSVDFLLNLPLPYELPFVKVAATPAQRRILDWIPRGVKVYMSVTDVEEYLEEEQSIITLFTVPKYPAELSDYSSINNERDKRISDHTPGLELFNAYRGTIAIWEKHIRWNEWLEAGQPKSSPDDGPFALYPDEMAKILKGEY